MEQIDQMIRILVIALALYGGMGFVIAALNWWRGAIRRTASEFWMLTALWPVQFILTLENLCGTAKNRLTAFERAKKIKLLPRCTGTLYYRAESLSGVLFAPAADCENALRESALRKRCGPDSWEQEFADWLASRDNSTLDATRVPELWNSIFAGIAPDLISKGIVKWECVECRGICDPVRKDREDLHILIADVYRCSKGHILFQKVVMHVSPARKQSNQKLPTEGLTQKQEKPAEKTRFPGLDGLHVVNNRMLGSMILEKQSLEQAQDSGRNLTKEQQKRLFILKCILGGDGLEPAFETRTLSLEEVNDVPVIGRFTFGRVKELLMVLGYSRGDVTRFLRRVQSGELGDGEAAEFLADCDEWQRIMPETQESRQVFFAKKRAQREQAKRNYPSHN
jgi:hypothetical protein